jgi:intracellular septation protein
VKFLFDLFPVILFFAAYFLYPQVGDKADAIFVATGVAIVATAIQVAWQWLRHRRVDRMLWINLGIILLLGGATLVFRDKTFILWKPTALYWLFAVTLFAADAFFGKNIVRAMVGQQLTLPDPVWRRLNASWIGFFVFMGFANLFVAYNFSEENWVRFKLFGGLGLTFLFALAQGLMLSRHLQDEQGG